MQNRSNTSYPLRAKRRVVSLSEELRASSPQVSRSNNCPESFLSRSGMDTHPDESTLSPVRTGLASTVEEDNVSVAPSGVSVPLAARPLPFVASNVGSLRPVEAVTTGFDRLDRAIVQLVQRLPEATLEEKFDVISQWIEQYHVDVVPHKVARQLGRIMTVVTNPATSPVKATVASVFVMHQLLLVLGRVKPILAPVADAATRSMMKAVFLDPPDSLTHTIVDVDLDPVSLEEELGSLQRRMYLQESRDLRRSLNTVQHLATRGETMSASNKRCLAAVVRRWTTDVKRSVFLAWRADVRIAKQEKQQVAERVRDQTEVKRLEERIVQLEAQLRAKDRELVATREGFAREREEILVQRDAYIYDVNEAREECAALSKQVEDFRSEADRLSGNLQAAKDSACKVVIEMEAEVSKFGTDFFAPAVSQMALAAWNKCGTDLAADRGVSDAVLLEWVRHLIEGFKNANEEQWGAWESRGLLPEHVISPRDMGSLPLMVGTLALILHVLFPETAHADEIERALLSQAISTTEKATWLSSWCAENRFPLHQSFFSVETMMQEDPHVSRLFFGRILRHAIAPQHLMCQSVLSETPLVYATFVSSPARALHIFFRHYMAIAPIATLADNYVNAAAAAVSLPPAAVPLSLEMQTDRGHFNVASAPTLSAAELHAIDALVEQFFPLVRSSFVYYAESERVGGTTLSFRALGRLAEDLHFVPRVDLSSVRVSLGDALNSKEFVVALVQLGRLARPQETHPAEALRHLLLRMHKFVPLTRPELVAAVKEEEPLRTLLHDVRNDLFKIFRKYCTDASPNRMGPTEFIKFSSDAGALDGHLSSRDVTGAFNAVCHANGEGSGGASLDTFVTLCCTLGLMRFPVPWQSSLVRASRFIFHCMFPALQKKVTLQHSLQ